MKSRPKRRLGVVLTAEDFFPEVEPAAEDSARDRCAKLASELSVGDVVRVGRSVWKVWRTHGVTVYLTKAGTKGKKLYQLTLGSFEPCVYEVHEINPGSGEIIPRMSPIAKGTLGRLE